MNLDPSLVAPLVTAWGPYGVILVILLLLSGYLGKALIASLKERLAEQRETLTVSLKTSADAAQALRDMKTTVDAVIAIARGK